ncbi:MAG: hypothetical protein ACOYUZ_03005 [Patescibacteria group bacterium]
MEELYLDLRDKRQIVDFLSNWLAFVPEDLKSKAEKIIDKFDDGILDVKEDIAEFAIGFAKALYPIRFAMDEFFKEQGALIEWDQVEKSVRRSTAHLMHRFKQNNGIDSIDELLDHEDFDMTFGDEERSEILQVRHFVREDYIKNHPKVLDVLIDEGKRVLAHFEGMMEKMRNTAGSLPTLLQEELYNKVTRYEDRVLFNGERIDLDVLKEELAYYTDQKEIPIE